MKLYKNKIEMGVKTLYLVRQIIRFIPVLMSVHQVCGRWEELVTFLMHSRWYGDALVSVSSCTTGATCATSRSYTSRAWWWWRWCSSASVGKETQKVNSFVKYAFLFYNKNRLYKSDQDNFGKIKNILRILHVDFSFWSYYNF